MKALIFGATGLIGGHLLNLLLSSEHYNSVVSLGRKTLNISHPKLIQTQIDFENLQAYFVDIDVDVVFCCLGTTIKKAGSQDNFKKIDYDYPVLISQIAMGLNVPRMVVVSSIGADPESTNFYLKTKGLMEKNVTASGLKFITFMRPSLLLGDREEFRAGEKIAAILMQLFGWLMVGPMRPYKAVKARDVAKAMLQASLEKAPPKVYSSLDIIKLANI
ncbi:MAG: nucleoside-diphosphate-sugar epimerase [Bacteroidetes bacterium]|nr:MAG: nucleoside-diphosphate-sugar epimerase [Bacteroidota bacterium]